LFKLGDMALLPGRRPARKRRNQYHHGDLRRALVQEAVQTIDRDGVAGLTVRQVGARLGVSRTALYRHFADKSALLAAVGLEGYRAFRAAMTAAGGDGLDGFGAMGRAYIEFARTHPAHYRVMFGGFLEGCRSEPELEIEAKASFQLLVDALATRQQRGLLVADDPQQMARYVWAIMHGIAMLTIDGQLRDHDSMIDVEYAITRLVSGLAMPPVPRV
jgi:AcrR family transcriptional regulator